MPQFHPCQKYTLILIYKPCIYLVVFKLMTCNYYHSYRHIRYYTYILMLRVVRKGCGVELYARLATQMKRKLNQLLCTLTLMACGLVTYDMRHVDSDNILSSTQVQMCVLLQYIVTSNNINICFCCFMQVECKSANTSHSRATVCIEFISQSVPTANAQSFSDYNGSNRQHMHIRVLVCANTYICTIHTQNPSTNQRYFEIYGCPLAFDRLNGM